MVKNTMPSQRVAAPTPVKRQAGPRRLARWPGLSSMAWNAAAADGAMAMFWPAARPSAHGSLPLAEWAKAAPLAIAMLLRRPAEMSTWSFFTLATPWAARVWLIIAVRLVSAPGESAAGQDEEAAAAAAGSAAAARATAPSTAARGPTKRMRVSSGG